MDETRAYIDAVEIYETDDYTVVNQYLATNEWVLADYAMGQDEALGPKYLYLLRRPHPDPPLPDWI